MERRDAGCKSRCDTFRLHVRDDFSVPQAHSPHEEGKVRQFSRFLLLKIPSGKLRRRFLNLAEARLLGRQMFNFEQQLL